MTFLVAVSMAPVVGMMILPAGRGGIRDRRGFFLLEIVVSCAIMGLALMSLITALTDGVRAHKRLDAALTGLILAEELFHEYRLGEPELFHEGTSMRRKAGNVFQVDTSRALLADGDYTLKILKLCPQGVFGGERESIFMWFERRRKL